MAPPITNCYTPAQVTEMVGRAGVYKANMRLDKAFLSSVSAGMLLAFACATLLSTNSSPWYQDNAPGLIRTISALVFPYGLTMVVLTGSDLCTGSFMYTPVAALQRRISPLKMVQHWMVTYFGNLAGSLFVIIVIVGYGGVFDLAAYRNEVIKFGVAKQVTPGWHMIFLRAIGANWLVCMACFLGTSGRDYASKVVGIWWPTFAFVSLGLDHVIANMSFIPLAIFYGAPDISVGLYIWKGMIPGFLGNMLGGGLFVGAFYWYLHWLGSSEIRVDGEAWSDLAGGMSERKQLSDEEIGRKREDSETTAKV